MKRFVLIVCVASLVPFAIPAHGAVVADGAGPAASYIVLLGPGEAPASVAAEHGRAFGVQVQHVYRFALQGYAASVPIAAVAGLRADPRVRAVVEDRAVTASGQLFPTGINRVD